MNQTTDSCACGTLIPWGVRDRGGAYECRSCGRKHFLDAEDQATAFVTPPPIQSVSHTDRKPPPETLGPYTILDEIGRGGMGTVYRAKDTQLNRDVAVKVLAEMYRGIPDFATRFAREARAAACINHRNIVQIYYTGEDHSIPFFGMELVSGKNLQDLVEERDFLSSEAAIDYMIQAAEGLRAAASQGIIHRDVKPTNLLVQSDGTLKIADFGLAKSGDFDSRLTITGAVVGTPYYMAPEQGKGEAVDHRADIYALGATFYHLLAGQPPFRADTPIGIIVKHINESAEPLSQFRDDLPHSLEVIINTMMAKDQGDRYADYDTLIADLAASRTGGRISVDASRLKKAHFATNHPKNKSRFVVLDATPPEVHLKKAGVLRWLFATLLDVIVLFGVERISLLATQWSLSTGIGQDFAEFRLVLVALAAAGYFIVLDAFGGQTIGKAFCRLRVGTVDGNDIGLFRSIIRFALFCPIIVASIASFAISEDLFPNSLNESFLELIQQSLAPMWVFVALDILYALTTTEKRYLHDALIGAFVYRRILVRQRAPWHNQDADSESTRKVTPSKPSEISPKEKTSSPVEDSTNPPKKSTGSHEDRARASRASKLASNATPKEHPNPRVAAFLGLIPGMGQVYNGEFFKGFLVFAGVSVLLVTGVGVIIWIYSIWQAHHRATVVQRARRVARERIASSLY